MKRRTFLKGTTVAVGTAGLAGCSSLPFFGDDGGVAGGVDWMPDPAEIDYTDMAPDNLPENQMDQYKIEQYSAILTNPSKIHGSRKDMGVNSWEQYRSFWASPPYAKPLIEDISLSLTAFAENSATTFQVYEAKFTPDRIKQRLESDDYTSESGDNDDYEYYLSQDKSQAYAFTDNTFITASTPSGAGNPADTDIIETVDAVIGAGNGDTERYVDVNENLKTAVNSTSGTGYMFFEVLDPNRYEENDNLQPNPETGEFEEQVAGGGSINISGSESNQERNLVFESESAVDEGDIEDYIEEGATFSNERNIQKSINGNVVTITSSVPTMDAF